MTWALVILVALVFLCLLMSELTTLVAVGRGGLCPREDGDWLK